MNHILAVVDGRFKVSIVDSTMMWIVHFAMDKAHEKVKSKEGAIGRLHEISMFYELAVMQLEGCLKFVQAEADNEIFEDSHAEVLSGLREIRNRLRGRLEDTELAICNKDRELNERLETEVMLRQALEVKERELVSLRENLELERSKSEEIEELIYASQMGRDEDTDDEICELRHSVDQQVWSIKQKLEPDQEYVIEERYRGIDNKRIDEMGADIHILKETLDLAFGKMQSALFSSELGPVEHQWRWTIEKNTMAIFMKGFITDFRESFESDLSKLEPRFPNDMGMHWSDLMNELANLREELWTFITQCEVPTKSIKGHETLAPSNTNLEFHTTQKTKGEPLMDVGTPCGSNYSSENEAEQTKEEQEEDGSNLVAKIIKTHESIIQKKCKELKWTKVEGLREKMSSSFKRDKDPDSLKRRAEEVILRLDHLMSWNAANKDEFGEYGGCHELETRQQRSFRNFDVIDRDDTLADAEENVNNDQVPDKSIELQNELRILQEKNKDLKFQTMIMEETYVTLFKCLVNDFSTDMYRSELESLIREGTWEGLVWDTVNNWKDNIEENRIQSKIREEINCVVFTHAIKFLRRTQDITLVALRRTHDIELVACRDIIAESKFLDSSKATRLMDYLNGTIREITFSVIFKEVVKEWKKSIESYNIENLVREEMNLIVFGETVKSIVDIADYNLGNYKREVLQNFIHEIVLKEQLFQCAVKADVCNVFFREMVWKWVAEIEAYSFDVRIREDIHQFIVLEGVRDAYFRDHRNHILPYSSIGDSKEEYFHQKIAVLKKCFQEEEDLVICANHEIKELGVYLDLVEMELKKWDEHNLFQVLMTKVENAFTSVGIKLENALHQSSINKVMLCELGSDLGTTVGSSEMVHDLMTPVGDIHDRNVSKEEFQYNQSDLKSMLLQGISQGIENCERMLDKRLGMNIGRLKEVKQYLDPLVEHIPTLRKKIALYTQAFIKRSENLQKAEIEVDLLGDQVDVLTALLETVYLKLHHNSPVLEQYFNVSDILTLIKKELIRGTVQTSKRC